ncbi:hypothetical protein CHH69_00090 [Terribacillus saccharophilus]|nr:hypothetical protein CHH69_00090 [Terribacillus saccharophilus]
MYAIADKLDQIPKNEKPVEEQTERVVYRFEESEKQFEITRDPDGAYVLYGEPIEKLFKMTDFNRDEAARRFSRQMRAMGVDEALRKRGAKDGDIIRLLELEFEFID